jgi:hypothetical protein
MLYPSLEKKLRSVRHAFETATSENIIELGKEYLALLEEHHSKLLGHPGAPGGGLQPASSSSYEIVHNTQETVRNLLTQTEQERGRVETILNPLLR